MTAGNGSTVNEIVRVGVVGCGVMGSGIAEACAHSGLDVRVAVSGEDSAVRGRLRLLRSLDHGLQKGRISEPERSAVLDRISFTTDLGDLSDRQFVVEAIRENELAKIEVFTALDKIVQDPDAILASNTSAIPIIRLGCATQRPTQVLGMHFFSPVPLLPLVELIGSLLTAERTLARADSFVTMVLGKRVIRSPDRAGFVVNALLIPYLLAAVRMVESGFATAEIVDNGMVLGCAHPVGPLRLIDLIGLDTIVSVARVLYEEFREPLYAPPPLLSRMVDGGLLGKKTGRGFYEYS